MMKTDLTSLNWDKGNVTASGNGSYYQAVDRGVSPTRHYKLSNFDGYSCRAIGYEAYFEVIAYRLGIMLGIDVLEYKLVNGTIRLRVRNRGQIKTVDTVLCCSEDFRRVGESKCSLSTWYALNIGIPDIEKGLRGAAEFIGSYIDTMYVFDFLICNRDRHAANIEVLQSESGVLRMSPLFDHGQSFCAPYGEDENAIKNFDYTRDIFYNDGIGTGHHYENLNRLSERVTVNKLPENFRDIIFEGMYDTLPVCVMESVAGTIEYRYGFLKNNNYITEV